MTETTTPSPNPRLGRLLPLALIAVGAVLGWYFLGGHLSFETLAQNRERLIAFRDANYLGTAAVFMALYAAAVAFSVPGAATPLTLTGGFLFTTFPGALFNVAGATVGATVLFAIVASGFGRGIAARVDQSDGFAKRFKAAVDENQWSALFLMRLVPAFPFFVANILPALFDVPLRRYVISTFFGIMPGAVVYTSVGAGLGGIFERGGTPDLRIIFEPQILLPILGLCALAALPIVVKLVRGKKGL